MSLPPTDALNWKLTEEQMAVLVEIRDLLKLLVEDRENRVLGEADAIRARRRNGEPLRLERKSQAK